MAKVIWTNVALEQLDAIAEVIALDKPEAAKKVVREIFDLTDKVERFKMIGRIIPEFPNTKYRQVFLKPCWIYYRIEDDSIFILHVRRGEQLFKIENLTVN